MHKITSMTLGATDITLTDYASTTGTAFTSSSDDYILDTDFGTDISSDFDIVAETDGTMTVGDIGISVELSADPGEDSLWTEVV